MNIFRRTIRAIRKNSSIIFLEGLFEIIVDWKGYQSRKRGKFKNIFGTTLGVIGVDYRNIL